MCLGGSDILPYSYFLYSLIKTQQAMANHLLKSIIWVIVTLIGIGLFFYLMEASTTNLMLVCYFSIGGFLTAFSEYLNYKQSKKPTRWQD